VRDLWQLLRHRRDFRRLASANLISLTGDWMVAVGLAYFVYELTGSTLASAGSMLASFLPGHSGGGHPDRRERRILPIIALQGIFGVIGGLVVLGTLRRQLAR
jgi:hypothetical protein